MLNVRSPQKRYPNTILPPTRKFSDTFLVISFQVVCGEEWRDSSNTNARHSIGSTTVLHVIHLWVSCRSSTPRQFIQAKFKRILNYAQQRICHQPRLRYRSKLPFCILSRPPLLRRHDPVIHSVRIYNDRTYLLIKVICCPVPSVLLRISSYPRGDRWTVIQLDTITGLATPHLHI